MSQSHEFLLLCQTVLFRQRLNESPFTPAGWRLTHGDWGTAAEEGTTLDEGLGADTWGSHPLPLPPR